VALGQAVLNALHFSLSIHLPMLHTHISLNHHQCCIILATDSIIKQNTSLPTATHEAVVLTTALSTTICLAKHRYCFTSHRVQLWHGNGQFWPFHSHILPENINNGNYFFIFLFSSMQICMRKNGYTSSPVEFLNPQA